MRSTTRRAAVLLTVLTAAACNVLGPGDDATEELEDALRLWRDRGLVSYEYRYTHQCGECLQVYSRTYDVRVVDGEVARVVDAATGGAPPEQYDPRTVPALFALIADAIKRAEVLHVEYDGDLGYPRLISVDYAKQIADDEFSIRVEGLRPLE